MSCIIQHVVCIPYPAQGHISLMLKLAKLLHNKGIHITFVNTEFSHKRLIKLRGIEFVQGFPYFQFHTIPDGLPPIDADSTQDIPSLSFSTKKNCGFPFRNLLMKLNETPDIPRVSCMVSYGIMSFTLAVAKEFGLPKYLFWTTSACGFMGYLHYHHLLEKGIVPLKATTFFFLVASGDLSAKGARRMDWASPHADFPAFARITDADDKMIDYLIGETANATKNSGIILNTFDELENEVVDVMRSGNLSHLLFIHLVVFIYLSIKFKPNSIVYVNFGSITVMTSDNTTIVQGDSAMLPVEFVEETKERCLFPTWCPQEEVLNHPAIGGFLTHGGWNSTLESIYGGVPMICWPIYAEQQTNCRYTCKHWGIGMEIETNVNRDVVEEIVRELMEGEKGKDTKKKVKGWKRKSEEAVAPGGSSYVNLNKMIDEILHAATKIIN
ncbi:hypothetical protein MKX01_003888 [Papaver californicum]|nr:hypothetical protein MKX01_003888 [Papaver californicum]